MLSEKMYKCMAIETPNDNMTSKENIDTNANVQGAMLAEWRQHD